MSWDLDTAFLDRARHEAERYGADAWVFVRELLQNARDAGAGRVRFDVDCGGGRERIVCRDDGEGMTWAHARDYLFTLYASSKRTGSRNAGRFGIGFWSILRFSPSRITVRSRTADGEGWQVLLNADLEVVGHEKVRMETGTEVVIERAAGGDDIVSRVRAAVLRDAPFLTRRGQSDVPLEVRVNTELIRADLDLPPPSLKFKRRGLRGVVSLGPEPRAEIFAHGLRVRDAASLDDLLLTGRRGREGIAMVSGGLAPQVQIDSSALTVLMARGDALEDKSLRRLVAVGHHELRRLVRAELDRHVRVKGVERLIERLRETWSASRNSRAVLVSVLVALGSIVGWRLLDLSSEVSRDAVQTGLESGPRLPSFETPQPYADIGERYRGPNADSLAGPSTAVDLTFGPPGGRPHFAALLITGIDASGRPLYPLSTEVWPFESVSCGDDCLDVEVMVAAGSGILRLPVATGYAVDPSSVRFNGEQLILVGFVGGLPAVHLGEGPGGSLSYRCGPATDVGAGSRGSWPELPPELSKWAAEMASVPVKDLARIAVDYVRRRVIYDTSPETAYRHRTEERRGRDLFERSLIVGAGDCDVQNAVVVALLDEIGVPARLAVGWVGDAGRVRPGLHAWVEFLPPDGRWRVADASVDLGDVWSPAPSVPALPVGVRTAFDPMVPLAMGTALLLIGLALLFGSGGGKRSFSPGDGDDFEGLLRAAAVRPQAFAGMHSLFSRRVVPVLGGAPISLARARAESGKHRLAMGGRNCALASRAAARGTVIDSDTTEGTAVADALGAVDLNEWQEVLSRSWTDPVAVRVATVLTVAGEPCRLRIAGAVGEDVAVFDGSRFGLSRSERWVVLDRSGESWKAVRDLDDRYPATAALLLADSVIDHLGVPRATRGDCLAELARAALAEQIEVRS